MAERNKPQITISAEELLKTELIVNQALIDILIAKQLISEEELVTAIKRIRGEQKNTINEPKKILKLKSEF